jgi:spore coat polysaccharide biosynthesis protein SpsF (cytidylyltransferase family)
MSRAAPLVVVQARVGSTRLPNKVLTDLCGHAVLTWLLGRIRRARLITGVVVATTTAPEDDAIEQHCRSLGIDVHRGAVDDVLGRYVQVAEATGAEALVRVSADSPLLDHHAVDTVVAAYREGAAELVQNHRPADWPIGTAIEVFPLETLLRIQAAAREPSDREHVTLYAYLHPEEFAIEHVPAPPQLRAPALRLCVDTAEDMEAIRELCRKHGSRLDVTLETIVAGSAS